MMVTAAEITPLVAMAVELSAAAPWRARPSRLAFHLANRARTDVYQKITFEPCLGGIEPSLWRGNTEIGKRRAETLA
jgi:hypothetical protein